MSEAEVRQAIVLRSLLGQGERSIRMVPEMALCQSQARIDLAVVGDQLVGWEIKTENDNLARLQKQVEVYSRIFDRLWLAADERHLQSAASMIPSWWGIVRIVRRNDCWKLQTIRPARLNRAIDLYSLVTLLWRNEVLQELERLGLAGGRDRDPRRQLWELFSSAAPRYISRRELRSRVRLRLKERPDWRVDRPQTLGGGSS
jgi:hypothetical protein